eukprot:CAMPEP_0184985600 /NCGR_PEP_ID=MMETSP1098-20130426/14199_1 /TAXON_ID=89044 /ORGANISM="Spumella elongata, Strain CCAP 955/1" /LENGTH=524 /DNA_ID=CAMNT_0027509693 /DNA_START=69 /DNA_END=1643 /DNA_ORIENTATION=+
MTFDERKVGGRTVAKPEEGHVFTKLQKRSMTFIAPSTAPTGRDRAQSMSIPDVMYRRHFGHEDEEHKPFSFHYQHGVTGDGAVAPVVVKPTEDNSGKAVVVTDTFTTGAVVANSLYKMGYKVICVLSADLKDLLKMIPDDLEVQFTATITLDVEAEHSAAIKSVIEQIHAVGLPVVAIFAGAETGVELADELSEIMGLRTNGTAQSDARRNKYVMGETVRAAGLRAVKQLKATVWADIENFLTEWNPSPYKVIVKPVDSAGSDDVTLCLSLKDVQKAFGNIIGKVNGLGLVNKAVLVQEYLEGQEYIIDMVSRDGVHKTAAVWAYDRRAVNGAGFVCFGQRMCMIDDPHIRELIEYQKKVITALGIRNGPTHGEVKWFQGEPVLVEVGARCHGVEGVWQLIVDAVLGYNQVQGTIAAYFDHEKFDAIPDVPMERHSDGRLVFLILYKDGLVEDFDHSLLAEMQNMPSFVSLEMFAAKGARVRKTIDCFTFGGVVRLINPDTAALVRDYERLREIEQIGFIKYAE